MSNPPSGEPPASPEGVNSSGLLKRHAGKLFASVLVVAAFAWLLHAGALPIVPDGAAMGRVKWWTFALYLGLWSVVHWIRAVRWTWLLAPIATIPRKRVIDVAFIGFFAIVVLPFRAGEMARPVLIRKKGELSGWAATGTIGAERVIDGLVLSLLLLVALLASTPLDPLPDRIGGLPVPASIVPTATYAALVLFAVAFVTMGLFFAKRELCRRWVRGAIGWASPELADWLTERVGKVADGIAFLPKARYSVPFVLATASYWLLNAAAGWLLAWGVGLSQVTFWHAAVVTGVLALGILLPNAPGFFGAFQISVYAALAMYFPPDAVTTEGSAYVFLLYVGQLLVTAGAASVGLLRSHTSLGEALGSRAGQLES